MSKRTNFCGIICEFNPLHFGHQAILTAARQIGPVVCVMSGNFVQRGEPALLDKWSRTRLALQSGADLVLELPLPWACAGAEAFAFGAVKTLSALGLSGSLLFGSECGDAPLLMQVAETLLSPAFASRLSSAMKTEKKSFAAVREEVMRCSFNPAFAAVLRQPNNILGTEYCKAVLKTNAPLTPCSLARVGAGHDKQAAAGQFMSASEIRQKILSNEPLTGCVPQSTLSLLHQLFDAKTAPHSITLLERSILSRLRSMTAEEFAALPEIGEGLEFKLFQSVKKAVSLEELYRLVKSKRYSHARIRRIIMRAYLGITADLPQEPAYLRVLGMNASGAALLKNAVPTLPLAVRSSDFQAIGGDALRLFAAEAHADDLYALSSPQITPCGADYTTPLIKL